MNVLLVYCHPEPHSFNHAMFQTACQALRKGRHKIRISDLHRMKFDPVSGRSAYKTVKNPERFRQQLDGSGSPTLSKMKLKKSKTAT